jgi:hypothetical protein
MFKFLESLNAPKRAMPTHFWRAFRSVQKLMYGSVLSSGLVSIPEHHYVAIQNSHFASFKTVS